MTHSEPCRDLKDAVKFSLCTQIPLMLLAGFVADGGIAWQICSFAFVGFNSYLVSVLVFRRHSPTKFDLIALRAGFLPTILLSACISNFVWGLRGGLIDARKPKSRAIGRGQRSHR